MAYVTLYGLDENGFIISTEIFSAGSDVLGAFAEQHLVRFPVVEVWEGRYCKMRIERRSPLAQLV